MVITRKISIDEYISNYPSDVQAILERLRGVIRESAPEAEEMIYLGIPTFNLNANLVQFAAYNKHIAVYLAPSGIRAFKKELSPYKHTRGTINFPIDESIPFNLVKKIVEYKISEVSSKE